MISNLNSKKDVERAIKSQGKKLGFKTIRGMLYKVQSEMLFIVTVVSVKQSDGNINVTFSLGFKPLPYDYLFWDIIGITANMKNEPFSIHVDGSFIAPTSLLHQCLSTITASTDIDYAISIQLQELQHKILATEHTELLDYYIADVSTQIGITRKILYYIYNSYYKGALSLIHKEIEENHSGGYIIGKKTFLQAALAYCNVYGA